MVKAQQSSQVHKEIIEEARERAFNSLFYWNRYVMGFDRLEEKPDGTGLHQRVCDWLQWFFCESDYEWAMLGLPRGCYKTTVAVIGGIPWLLYLGPDLRIMLGHATHDDGCDYLGDIRQNLEERDRIKQIGSHVFYENPRKESPKWQRDSLVVRRSFIDKVPSVRVAGVDKGVAGKHYHIHVLDDLHDDKNYKTDAFRVRVKNFIKAVIPTTRRNDGKNRIWWKGRWKYICPKKLIVFTPWHFDDGYQMIKEMLGDKVARFELGLYGEPGHDPMDDEVETILPHVYPKEQIPQIRKSMGHLWASQCLLYPIAEQDKIFHRDDIQWFGGGLENLPKNRSYNIYTAIDPNSATSPQSDFGVVSTYALDHIGHLWQIDQDRGHYLIDDQEQLILEHVKKYGPKRVFVESVAYQVQLFKRVQRTFRDKGVACYVQEVKRTGKNRKEDRIYSLQPLVSNKMLHLMHGKGEHTAHELDLYKAIKNDDTLDTLADVFHYGTRPKPPVNVVQTPEEHHAEQALWDQIHTLDQGHSSYGRGRLAARRSRMVPILSSAPSYAAERDEDRTWAY